MVKVHKNRFLKRNWIPRAPASQSRCKFALTKCYSILKHVWQYWGTQSLGVEQAIKSTGIPKNRYSFVLSKSSKRSSKSSPSKELVYFVHFKKSLTGLYVARNDNSLSTSNRRCRRTSSLETFPKWQVFFIGLHVRNGWDFPPNYVIFSQDRIFPDF